MTPNSDNHYKNLSIFENSSNDFLSEINKKTKVIFFFNKYYIFY